MYTQWSAGVAVEWDEVKRFMTLMERGMDFADAAAAFDGRPALHVPARLGNEARWLTVTMMQGKFYTIIWTWRDVSRRIISFRRARDGEERNYRAIFG